jgi:hypothetical protein
VAHLSLVLAKVGDTFPHGTSPSVRGSMKRSHSVCTAHVALRAAPQHEHLRLMTPLPEPGQQTPSALQLMQQNTPQPDCLFFLRNRRKQISSPSLQIMDWDVLAISESGSHLRIGSAWRSNNTQASVPKRQHHARLTSDGRRSRKQ